jgi:Fibronectin type III domain
MKKIIYILLLKALWVQGQVGLNTTTVHPSAQLQLESTQKGFLTPRLEPTQINAIIAPAEGLLLYNTNLNYLDWFNGQQWINPKTKPSSPFINSITTAATSATLNFTNSTNMYITGYEVLVQPGNLVVSGTSSPIVVSNLVENTLHSFTLVSVTNYGKGVPSPVLQATTLYSAPTVPTQLDVTPANGSVSFLWGSSNGVVTNYRVAYKEVNAAEWTEIQTNSTSVSVPNLTNNSTYVFKVKAENSVGTSDFSNVIYAVPVANTILMQDNFINTTQSQSIWAEYESNVATNNFQTGIIGISNSRLKIEGTNTSDNFNYVHYAKSLGKDNADLVIQFNLLMPSCASPSLNTFKYGAITKNSTAGNYIRIGKSDATTINRFFNTGSLATNATINCEDNQVLHYRFVFKQNNPVEVYVNGIIESTLGSLTVPLEFYTVNNGGIAFVGIGTNPYFIEGISISGKPIRPQRPNLRWEKPSVYVGNNSALIYFDPSNGDGGSPITGYEITTTPATTPYVINGFPSVVPNLVNGTSYTFRARAINAFGFSDYSQTSASIIPSAVNISPLVYPLNNSVLLQWRVANDAIDYAIEYKEASSNDWIVFNDGVSAKTQTTVTSLTNGNMYDFRIKPLTNFAAYDYSAVISTSPTNTYDPNCWNHILSSGQSLSLGHSGSPALTTVQPYNNKQLTANLGNTTAVPVPLLEGGSERVYSAMANSITKQVGYPAIPLNIISSLKAYGGVPYTTLKKGTEAYNTLIDNTFYAKKWSNEVESKPYLVRGVTIIHGENDSGNMQYKENLVEWQNDYQNDIKAITGQVDPIPMFTCQTATNSIYGISTSISAMGQLNAALENPGKIILVTPKYFLDYSDGLHLNNYTYKYLGEYYGKVMKKVIVDKETWLPLHAIEATILGNVITVTFHVPAPPLQFDTTSLLEQFNKGFEYFDDAQSADIQSVALGANGTSVIITLTNVPTGANKKVAYAYTGIPAQGAGREKVYSTKGNLCDSDAFPVQFPGNYPSYYSNTLKNWCVTFIKNVE